MSNFQIEIIPDHSLKDNDDWKQLISLYAVAGQRFEIHCWKEETEEIKAALNLGTEKTTDWKFGSIIEGVIDDRLIDVLCHTIKPSDTKIYNKMTPFFSIFFESGFSSEHYGTEIHISSEPNDAAGFTALLKKLRDHAVINTF